MKNQKKSVSLVRAPNIMTFFFYRLSIETGAGVVP